MIKVLTAEQMREVDRLTTERYGIPSIILMENAAHAVARVITAKLGGSVRDRRILIVCGKGNNGGDGAALARILFSQGASCFVELVGSVTETRGDARINFDAIKAINDECDLDPDKNCVILSEIPEDRRTSFFHDWRNKHMCVLVDALFGTGLARPLESPYDKIVEAITRAKRRNEFELMVAVDVPSGLDSDSAEPIGPHATSDVTVTFTAPKSANILGPVSNSNGELIVENIGSPRELLDEQPSQFYLAEQSDAAKWLSKTAFSNDSYKNRRGHSLIFAGSDNYSGAAVMCGNAAMRSGVGLTTLLVPASCKVEVASRVIPEVIVGTIGENADAIAKADSILIGPGLDANDGGIKRLVHEIVSNRKVPIILDAGALWFCNPPDGLLLNAQVDNHPIAEAATPTLRKDRRQEQNSPPLILTPHEGEFIRLLGTDDKEVLKDRLAAVREYAVTHGVILVLKGERVLIGTPDGRVVVNPTGNSGLGKAGNGDTLAGILAGFIAQAVRFQIDIVETVVAAVYVAGMAGDVAEKKYGKRVMTASDVRECLVDVFAAFEEE